MADVLISYAHEDRPFVQRMVERLEAESFSVWWDHTIPPGKTWDDVIARGIADAKVCIVVWSKHSIESDWVKEEATLAREGRKLLPVEIDGSVPPVGFRRIQAANLSQWEGNPNDPQWRMLVAEAGKLARGEGPTQAPVPPRRAWPSADGPRSRLPAVLMVAIATTVVALIASYFVMRAPERSATSAAPSMQAETAPAVTARDPAQRREIERLQRERDEAVAARRVTEQHAEEERTRRDRDQAVAEQRAAEERARKTAEERIRQDARAREEAAARTAPPAKSEITGLWVGQYQCVQGVTGVKVSITENAGAVNAQFDFHAVRENPGVPSGAFTLRGRYDPSTGALALQTERWLRRPGEYSMVSFRGQFDNSRKYFSGQVQFEGCGWIRLQRQ